MAEYYAQRASAGLLITEATAISHQGQGYADVPGLYGSEQLAGWKRVTDAVHARGGRIVTQLWHVGRVSHVELLGAIQARHVGIALALVADGRGLGDQQAGAGALRVVLGHQRRGDRARRAGAGEGRHHDAVVQLQVACADGIEKAGHRQGGFELEGQAG